MKENYLRYFTLWHSNNESLQNARSATLFNATNVAVKNLVTELSFKEADFKVTDHFQDPCAAEYRVPGLPEIRKERGSHQPQGARVLETTTKPVSSFLFLLYTFIRVIDIFTVLTRC